MRRTERSKKNKSYITVSCVHDAAWRVGIYIYIYMLNKYVFSFEWSEIQLHLHVK